MLKHVGRSKINKKKLIVAFRTLPDDPTSCLCIPTESLEHADHDSLINVVESNAGQSANELSETMARSVLSDGSNMLARFHTTGKLVKFKTDEVEMTPTPTNYILLSDLNKLIAEQQGVAIEELAVKGPSGSKNPKPVELIDTEETLTDDQIAANYRSQADTMFKEAKRLRDEAEKLSPTKKKITKSV